MTPYDRQIRNILRTIAVLLCIVIVCLVYLMMPRKQQPRVIFDIDPLEMQAMSTDSLHPDSALLWKDTVNNISHVSYNYSK